MISIGLCFLLEEVNEAAAETDCEDNDLLFRLVELDALRGALLAEWMVSLTMIFRAELLPFVPLLSSVWEADESGVFW